MYAIFWQESMSSSAYIFTVFSGLYIAVYTNYQIQPLTEILSSLQRCMEERQQKLERLTNNITRSIAESAPVRKTKLAYLDTAVKPPRNVMRKQVINAI